MKTKIELEVWCNNATRMVAGVFTWRAEPDFPLLQPGIHLRLGGKEYLVDQIVVDEDGTQEIGCTCDIGNRLRKESFEVLTSFGWTLIKEY